MFVVHFHVSHAYHKTFFFSSPFSIHIRLLRQRKITKFANVYSCYRISHPKGWNFNIVRKKTSVNGMEKREEKCFVMWIWKWRCVYSYDVLVPTCSRAYTHIRGIFMTSNESLAHSPDCRRVKVMNKTRNVTNKFRLFHFSMQKLSSFPFSSCTTTGWMMMRTIAWRIEQRQQMLIAHSSCRAFFFLYFSSRRLRGGICFYDSKTSK